LDDSTGPREGVGREEAMVFSTFKKFLYRPGEGLDEKEKVGGHDD
jgi:hypothetical protein